MNALSQQRMKWRLRYGLARRARTGPDADVWHRSCIFIHIPKAAGSSIATLDVGYTFGHQPYSFYERWLPPDQQMPPTMAVVRDPVDRYLSAFGYLQQERGNPLDHAWAVRNRLFEHDADSFARERLGRPQVQRGMHFRPQVWFTTGSEARVAVDHILRFESLADQWPGFATQHGLPERLPVQNRAPESDAAKRELSTAALAAIRELYADDFDTFGY